jgi:hypothetical protein
MVVLSSNEPVESLRDRMLVSLDQLRRQRDLLSSSVSCGLRDLLSSPVSDGLQLHIATTKGIAKVLPGLEPGLQGSKPWVLTNYTIEPVLLPLPTLLSILVAKPPPDPPCFGSEYRSIQSKLNVCPSSTGDTHGTRSQARFSALHFLRARDHVYRPEAQAVLLDPDQKGRAGVEPATYRAATNCSTTELTPHACFPATESEYISILEHELNHHAPI